MYIWGLSLAGAIPSVRMSWWFSASMMAPLALIDLCWFQDLTLPMHIHNKRAVAEMLRDRWDGVVK